VAQPVKLSASAISVQAVALRTFGSGLEGMVFVLLQLLGGGGGVGGALQGSGGHGGARGGVVGALALPAGIEVTRSQHQSNEGGALGPPEGGGDQGEHGVRLVVTG
jgi:hypothetical protein